MTFYFWLGASAAPYHYVQAMKALRVVEAKMRAIKEERKNATE